MSQTNVIKRKRYYEPKCSKIAKKYDWRVDDEGHHYLVEVGEYNFDDEIQLFRDSCDIKIIIDKLINGDAATITMLAQPLAYGDVDFYPQEVHPRASAQGLLNLYENQPNSVKEKFPTYQLFEKYFLNLTDAMIAEMSKPVEQVKEGDTHEK